ncbi:MAG: flagellar motor switch protein FliG [Steroidobacteraceae bacterium]|jgi:flagellar motor switch protein FliG|nr:flagellar motor switch protein FliG [Steroidobacteraceae bacterium]
MAGNVAEASGAERAAILLLSLGEQEAAAIIRHMDAREVQRVSEAMAALKDVPRERTQTVVAGFIDSVEKRGAGGSGAREFVRRMLTTSLGRERAERFLERLAPDAETGAGMDQLKWMHPRQVADLLREEHPQVVATVLAHLDPEQGGAVAALLPESLRSDVVLRVATIDEVPQSALKELDGLVEQRAAEATSGAPRRLGGKRLAANILNALGTDQKGAALAFIEERDAELCQQIKDQMFVFENLMQVDDRGIQAVLREVPSDVLATALRGADPEVQEKLFRNMSKRAAEILKDEMEVRGPVRLAEVEAAQREIVGVAQRLAEDGTIVIGGSGGGDYV